MLLTESGEEFVLAEMEDIGPETVLIRQQNELMELLAARSRSGRTMT